MAECKIKSEIHKKRLLPCSLHIPESSDSEPVSVSCSQLGCLDLTSDLPLLSAPPPSTLLLLYLDLEVGADLLNV